MEDTKKTARKKAVPTKRTSRSPRGNPGSPERVEERPAVKISPEERHRLIAEAAYLRASRRGFTGGAEVEDWLAAEAEIDDKLLGQS